jgi:hypothetical protein
MAVTSWLFRFQHEQFIKGRMLANVWTFEVSKQSSRAYLDSSTIFHKFIVIKSIKSDWRLNKPVKELLVRSFSSEKLVKYLEKPSASTSPFEWAQKAQSTHSIGRNTEAIEQSSARFVQQQATNDRVRLSFLIL